MNDRVLPEIHLVLCNRCGACVLLCPTHALEMGSEGPFIARPDDCAYCATCETYCPNGAISSRIRNRLGWSALNSDRGV